MNCQMTEDGTCAVHGGYWVDVTGCQTWAVLSDVEHERARQFARYGLNADLENGTGPNTAWLLPLDSSPAGVIEKVFRQDYEDYAEETGNPTWVHLVREEVTEAFQESDPVRLRAELLQVAALAVSWIEKLDRPLVEATLQLA